MHGIVLNGVGKCYARWVFRGFSYTFRPSGGYFITGGNGVGKSTLARLLLGFEQPTEGSITRGGEAVAFSSPDLLLPQALSVWEVTTFYLSFSSGESWGVQTALREAALLRKQTVSVSSLSLGMQQRLKLSLAFATSSRVLLLDEPFAHLDEAGTRWCACKIAELLPHRLVIICESKQHAPLNMSMEKIYLEKFCKSY